MTASVLDSPGAWLAQVRERRPLVHCITNLVAAEFTANVLLALHASPVMAHAPEEAADTVAAAQALLLNLGTLDRQRLHAMQLAGRRARDINVPMVLDPVGAGAIPTRTAAAHHLIEVASPQVIRGNAGEILALATGRGMVRGVDSVGGSPPQWSELASFAVHTGAVVVATGPEDLLTDGRKVVSVGNGHALLTRVSATGCSLSAVIAAFTGVWASTRAKRPLIDAVSAAIIFFNVAGETAGRYASGPGSFKMHFIDALATLAPSEIDDAARVTRFTLPAPL